MDHSILLFKLQQCGIRGIALDWFRDYLLNRVQHTFVHGVLSSSLNVFIGVPQGSILGPLLFLLYINDLCKSSNLLTFYQFADDTSIFFSSKDLNNTVRVLNNELKNISDWLKANKLSLNIDKTKCVYFRKTKYNIGSKISKISDLASNNGPLINNDNIPIYINNKLIQLSNSVNFLGVVLDNCLGFKDHITNVLHKISRNAGLINKLKYSLLTRKFDNFISFHYFPLLEIL